MNRKKKLNNEPYIKIKLDVIYFFEKGYYKLGSYIRNRKEVKHK